MTGIGASIKKVVDSTSPWSGHHEYVVKSLTDYVQLVERLSKAYKNKAPWQFVWRGQGDAKWPLHSSLYRKIALDGASPDEAELATAEKTLIDRAVLEWQLDRHAVGRLTGLELVAAMQHLDAPTRMLDFSHNALIALWFAVEEEHESDARVIAVDVTNVKEGSHRRSRQVPLDWTRTPDLPWSNGWTAHAKQAHYWTPHPIEPRMARQQGCFLLGAVPEMPASRRHTSLALTPAPEATLKRLVSLNPGSGKYPGELMILIRLELTLQDRQATRRTLERMCGFSRSMMYPDMAGFVKHGTRLP